MNMRRGCVLLILLGAVLCAIADEALPRIQVRAGRFVVEQTGEAFMPYGVNYCRLDNGWHSVFSIGCYNAERFDAMLADLKQNQMNVVRIFLDHRNEKNGGGIATDGLELSKPYVANMLDGLARARRHGIYVILCLNGQLMSEAYHKMFAEPVPMAENDMYPLDATMCSLGNMKFFHPGALKARGEYFRRVVQAIADSDPALLSTVFSYELENESYFVGKAPLSLYEGTFEFNGDTCDLSKDADLRRLMDEASVAWANSGAAAIRSADSKAMVSVNVFTYQAVGRKNLMAVRPDQGADWDKKQRIPVNLKALAQSTLDYLDTHIYLHRVQETSVAEKLEETLSSIDFDGLVTEAKHVGKPVIVGEFAAFKNPKRTLDQQVDDIREQIALCGYRGSQGFLYWTYDTDEQPDIHNLKMNNGRFMDVMVQWWRDNGF